MKIWRIAGGFIIGWVIASIIVSFILAILGMLDENYSANSSTTDTIGLTIRFIAGIFGTIIAYNKTNPKNY